jgi:hypothetical protein
VGHNDPSGMTGISTMLRASRSAYRVVAGQYRAGSWPRPNTVAFETFVESLRTSAKAAPRSCQRFDFFFAFLAFFAFFGITFLTAFFAFFARDFAAFTTRFLTDVFFDFLAM